MSLWIPKWILILLMDSTSAPCTVTGQCKANSSCGWTRSSKPFDPPKEHVCYLLSSNSHFWIVWKYGSTVPQFPIIIYHAFPFCRRPGTTLRSTERSSADWKHLTGVFLGISSKHLTFSQYQPRRSEIIFPPIASNWGILLALIPQDGVSTNSTWWNAVAVLKGFCWWLGVSSHKGASYWLELSMTTNIV